MTRQLAKMNRITGCQRHLQNKRNNFICILALIVMSTSCEKRSDVVALSVENNLSFERQEVVSVQRRYIDNILKGKDEVGVMVREKGSEKFQVIQWIDNTTDGQSDELLFQVNVGANATKEYEIIWSEKAEQLQPNSDLTTYSRFVPERTDDYAWENDKVAFRTFGPEAQRLTEINDPLGTLSSGIDIWLKRVNYSIIDKWYQGNLDDPGYYHIDHGEGHDPYHVGKSRGAGGIGIWKDNSLITSKNFINYKTITNGPLRTVFEIDYAPWSEFNVEERKRISLDLGSNFSKVEISLKTNNAPNYTIGITTHDLNGEERLNIEKGWFRYWEKIDSAYLGVGVVIDPGVVKQAFVYESTTPDQSQILIVNEPTLTNLTYYTGFAWTKSGQINSQEDWDQMLEKQAQVLANPLKIQIAIGH